MSEEKDIRPEEAEELEATPETQGGEDTAPEAETPPEDADGEVIEVNPLQPLLDEMQAQLVEKEDKLLRLAAEIDNFRRRSQKEKDGVWADATAKAVNALLPVYDNLERALKQETADEAYKKGVEMTMAGLKEVLSKLGIEEIPALGETFDPNLHNAVMHVEDGEAGENTIVEVFQTGFQAGDKVIRFAMVKVAN